MTDYYKPFTRACLTATEFGPIVAYDYETGRIPEKPSDLMTVPPKYVTAYGKNVFQSQRLATEQDVLFAFSDLWVQCDDRTRLVAYNGNRFDLRILMSALARSAFTVEPFFAKQAGLRGAVIRHNRKSVYVLDAIAMIGPSVNLKTFLEQFAPAYQKHKLDLSRVEFNPGNPKHVAYAERDSEGLYHAMVEAERLVKTVTGIGLQCTIGGLGIRTFASRMPRSAISFALDTEAFHVVRRIVMRGGYVYARKYKGRLWTYDLNQAYAAAMRDCKLPAGRMCRTQVEHRKRPGVYEVVLGRKQLAPVPYPVRNDKGVLVETFGEGIVTWLTSDEIRCLRRHGWLCVVQRGFVWQSHFSMTTFVNSLEARRKAYASGTAMNTIVKNIGNNAYGKTLQESGNERYIVSAKRPRGAFPVFDGSGEHIDGLWFRTEKRDTRRRYERPQIGAFITAHVRTVLYDAIMGDPDHFVKCDTDSVSFTRPQTLLISPWRYGDWKLVTDGKRDIVIGKKVYWSTGKGATCKGLRVKQLKRRDFERWFAEGTPPNQTQVQLLSWKKSLAPLWRVQERSGTRVG